MPLTTAFLLFRFFISLGLLLVYIELGYALFGGSLSGFDSGPVDRLI